MGFSRQEYWSGSPFPSPGDLPSPGMESMSLSSSALAGRFFATVPPGKPRYCRCQSKKDVVFPLTVVHQGLDLSWFPSVAQSRSLLMSNDWSILTILATHPRVLSGSSTTTVFTTLALIPPKFALALLAATPHL